MKKIFKIMVTLSLSVVVLTGCLTTETKQTAQDMFTYAVLNQLKTGTSLTGVGTVEQGSIPIAQDTNEMDITYDVTLNNRSLLFNINNKLANGEIETTKFISSLDANLDTTEHTKYEMAVHKALSLLKSLKATDFEYDVIDSSTAKMTATKIEMNQAGTNTKFASHAYSIEIIANTQDYSIQSIIISHDEIDSDEEISQDSLMLLVNASSKAEFEKSIKAINNSSSDLWQTSYVLHRVELTK